MMDTLKQVGNQVGGFINRSTIGNIQRGALSLSRGVNGAVGHINGTFRYVDIRRNVESFGAREVMDSQIMKEQLKIMSKCAERLSTFNANTFSGIYKTYSSNPRKLKTVVQDIITIYIHDVTAFQTAYVEFIKALQDSLNLLDNLDETLMSSVLSFLEEAEKLAEEGKFNVPPSSVDKIKSQIREFIVRQKNKLDKYSSDEAEEIARVQRNTAWKTIKTMMGISWVSFKTKRVIDKISKGQLKIILDDIAELERQVANKKLEVNFLPLIQEYLGSIDSCEVMAKDFRDDIKLLFSTVEKDYSLVRKSIAEFITILGNEEGVDVLKNLIENIEKMVDNIKSELASETKDVDKLKQDLAELQQAAPKLLDNIRNLSQAMLNKLQNTDNTNQVLKDFTARK